MSQKKWEAKSLVQIHVVGSDDKRVLENAYLYLESFGFYDVTIFVPTILIVYM
jgi:hypothetical protein